MTSATESGESAEVLAFLAERRGPVLESAVADLDAAEVGELPEVVHRLRGVLGSYGLAEAHVHITALAGVVGVPGSPNGATATQAGDARDRAVRALRELQQGEPT